MPWGALSLLSSGFLLALSSVFIKMLSDSLSGLGISFMRFAIAFVIALIACILLREAFILRGVSRATLLLYALVFPAAVVLFVFAVYFGSVALASSSAFAMNILVSFVIGRLLYQEKFHREKILSALLVFLALVLLLFSQGSFALSLGLLFGVLCGVAQGVVNYSQKRLGEDNADKSSLLLLQTASGALLTLLALLFFEGLGSLEKMPTGDWYLLLANGAMIVVVISLFAFGFRHTSLNTGSILVSSQLFFAPLLAYIILGESITVPLFVAIVSIFAAVLLVNYKEGFFNRGSLQE